uniref:C-type lectin domain-containing protein n=1 Tax=Cyclopterus lumpus TaxID=8103 RepID=A0A8C3AT90_CYCLU
MLSFFLLVMSCSLHFQLGGWHTCIIHVQTLFTQCYKIVVGDKKWNDARKHCINQGGNLVSITNEREQGECFLSFLTISVSLLCLIKVTSLPVSGEWMWVDNSAVDYVNWKTGMPKSDSCPQLLKKFLMGRLASLLL